MNGLRFLKRFWQALPFSDQVRWHITAFMLEPLLPFIRGSVVHTAYLREKEWQARHLRPFSGDALPVLPQQERTDVLMLGIIDWRFRIQRPQHIARALADTGLRVFYVSTAFVNACAPGFELECLDDAGRLHNVRLHMKGGSLVQAEQPSPDHIGRLDASVATLLKWVSSRQMVVIVLHPYWHDLAVNLPADRLIYDCMDFHGGFGNTGLGLAALEQALMKEADAVVTTSQPLYDIATEYNPHVRLIRNGVEYAHFSDCPGAVFSDPRGRRVLGYFGAIAKWMDLELLEKVARRFEDCLLLLVGADECGARQRLAVLPNICFTGEVKYAELPYYLHGMDVCLLPFRVTPLTLATNPVKIYEYLAAGKPVVALALPELEQFGSLVASASSHEEFAQRIEEVLAARADDQRKQRKDFAAQNTWRARAGEYAELLRLLIEERRT